MLFVMLTIAVGGKIITMESAKDYPTPIACEFARQRVETDFRNRAEFNSRFTGLDYVLKVKCKKRK